MRGICKTCFSTCENPKALFCASCGYERRKARYIRYNATSKGRERTERRKRVLELFPEEAGRVEGRARALRWLRHQTPEGKAKKAAEWKKYKKRVWEKMQAEASAEPDLTTLEGFFEHLQRRMKKRRKFS